MMGNTGMQLVYKYDLVFIMNGINRYFCYKDRYGSKTGHRNRRGRHYSAEYVETMIEQSDQNVIVFKGEDMKTVLVKNMLIKV